MFGGGRPLSTDPVPRPRFGFEVPWVSRENKDYFATFWLSAEVMSGVKSENCGLRTKENTRQMGRHKYSAKPLCLEDSMGFSFPTCWLLPASPTRNPCLVDMVLMCQARCACWLGEVRIPASENTWSSEVQAAVRIVSSAIVMSQYSYVAIRMTHPCVVMRRASFSWINSPCLGAGHCHPSKCHVKGKGNQTKGPGSRASVHKN